MVVGTVGVPGVPGDEGDEGVGGVGGVGGADARLVGQRGRWRALDGGTVTRDRSLRHALPNGYESWRHARWAEWPSLSSGYVNFHDGASRESSSANTPASTALTASAVRDVTFSLRIAARSC